MSNRKRKLGQFKLWVLLLFISGITAWMLNANSVGATSTLATIIPEFQPILPRLNQTKVPLRLPTYISLESARETATSRDPSNPEDNIYTHLLDVSSDSYVIILGAREGCEGGNACRLGSISGTKKVKNTPSDENLLKLIKKKYNSSPQRRSKEQPEVVTLVNGIKGYFDPWTCAGICGDADLIWDENGYRYTLGIKVGVKRSLVKMVNSAITNKAKGS